MLLLPAKVNSWGFFAHRLINKNAVFCLPPALISFYKEHISYLETHATDPDNRRYLDKEEAPRHYIDYDHYEGDSVPHTWNKAVSKYGEDTLKAHGIVPWHIQRMYYRLVKAFSEKNISYVLRTSADIGHYIADAHVPLHTTSNYNGQKTNQKGIHGFWESRIPELFSSEYDLFTGRATYIDNVTDLSWQIIHESFSMKDSVLLMEASLNERYPAALKYTYEQRNSAEIKTYSVSYSREYSDQLNQMVERRMRMAILRVASVWYSAWLDAGQPILEGNVEIIEAADTLKPHDQVIRLSGHED